MDPPRKTCPHHNPDHNGPAKKDLSTSQPRSQWTCQEGLVHITTQITMDLPRRTCPHHNPDHNGPAKKDLSTSQPRSQASVLCLSALLLPCSIATQQQAFFLMDIMLTGADQPQANQPNNLAEGPPM
eukprot:1160833-Pelagomonas_calceolata.AAC.3